MHKGDGMQEERTVSGGLGSLGKGGADPVNEKVESGRIFPWEIRAAFLSFVKGFLSKLRINFEKGSYAKGGQSTKHNPDEK